MNRSFFFITIGLLLMLSAYLVVEVRANDKLYKNEMLISNQLRDSIKILNRHVEELEMVLTHEAQMKFQLQKELRDLKDNR